MSEVEDKKPEYIGIRVVDQNQSEMHFKVKKSLPLQRIFDAYAEKQGKNVKDLRFTSDGNRIKGNMTAEQLGLQDGETLEVFLEQLGGSNAV